MNWQEKVCGQESDDYDKAEWLATVHQVCKRANYLCFRCGKKFVIRQLSAHHVMPRSKGGGDQIENLVALCKPCHNYVDSHSIETRAGITTSYESRRTAKPRSESPDPTDWHTWVYGGCKNPNL